MIEIIDLSQEIYTGMPVFPSLPEVNISMHVSHEQWDGITDNDIISPAVNRLALGRCSLPKASAWTCRIKVFAS